MILHLLIIVSGRLQNVLFRKMPNQTGQSLLRRELFSLPMPHSFPDYDLSGPVVRLKASDDWNDLPSQTKITGRNNGFTERQRRSPTRDKSHHCTPLTRDKKLSLMTSSGESSGDEGRFFTPLTFTFGASERCYLISLCTPIKGVV